jgi:hypothetical protein
VTPQHTPTAGNDPAAAQQTPQPTPEPSPEPQPAPAVIDDPDLLDLEDAKREAAAEAAGGDGNKAQTDQTQQVTEQPQDQGPQPRTQPSGQPMIPKARLDQEIDKRSRAEQEAAYWRGRAEGAQPAQGPQPAAGAPPPQSAPQPTVTIASIKEARLKAAKDFDDGTISAVEWETKRTQLDDQEQQIRQADLLSKIPQNVPAAGQDLILEERTAEIEQKHPYSGLVFPVQPDNDPIMDARRTMLHTEAHAAVIANNPGIQPGPRADLLLRQELARLTDQYGPQWFPNHKAAAPPAPQPQPAPQMTMSDRANNRLGKLVTQSQQPPNLGSAGRAGAPESLGFNEAQIANMTDDQIAALPRDQRAKILGVAN